MWAMAWSGSAQTVAYARSRASMTRWSASAQDRRPPGAEEDELGGGRLGLQRGPCDRRLRQRADPAVQGDHGVGRQQVRQPLRVGTGPAQLVVPPVRHQRGPAPHGQPDDRAPGLRRGAGGHLHQAAVAAGHHGPALGGDGRADLLGEHAARIGRSEPGRADDRDGQRRPRRRRRRRRHRRGN